MFKPDPIPFYSLDDIRRRNIASGGHWFDPSAIRFFRSRLSETIYPAAGSAFFVSSEQGPRSARRYTVRRADQDGTIDDHGDFQAHATSRAAHRAAKAAAVAWEAEHGAAWKRRLSAFRGIQTKREKARLARIAAYAQRRAEAALRAAGVGFVEAP